MKKILILALQLILIATTQSFNRSPVKNEQLKFFEQSIDEKLNKYTPTYGIVFSDIDNDGQDDLIVSNHGWFRPSIYMNDHGGFKDYSFLLPLDRETMDRHGITVVDIDNDGDKDILIAAGGADGIGPGGANHIFLNRLIETGVLEFIDITSETNLALNPMRSRSFIPLSSPDGTKIDLYLTAKIRPGTTNIYYRNDSFPGNIRLVPDEIHNLNESVWSDGRDIFFDWDRDGDQDLLAILVYKAHLYTNIQGKFHKSMSRLGSLDHVTSAAVGDLNNDGFLDIMLGSSTLESLSDNYSYDNGSIHIAFMNANPYSHSHLIDIDGIDIYSDSDRVDIDFWIRPGLSPNDPSDIFIGKTKKNPPSRIATITSKQAEGRPTFEKEGIYIWHNSKSSSWHLYCKLGLISTFARGKLQISRIQGINSHQLEMFPKERALDKILINDQGQNFQELENLDLFHNLQTRAIAIWDFNNDGWQDIIGIRGDEPGEYNGNPIILINQSDLNFRMQTYNPFDNEEDDIYQADMIAVGFVNQDGLPDVFMTNGYGLIPGSRGPYKLFINETQNANRYVLIELLGKKSNKDAIGAQVELFTDDDQLLGYRELGAGYNLIQSTHKLHFGLGSYSGKVVVKIRWPSGKISQRQVEANRLIHIKENQ